MAGAIANVHSIQTLGTLDGPGVRFVAFLQGCNLRCGCCHNPDTWQMSGGSEYSASELYSMAEKYRSYFGGDGGVTLSGGEPLCQAEFVYEFFSECKKNGINTCLDTSGSILDDNVKKALTVTDRVLLDIKYTTDELYRKHVGCSIDAPRRFLSYLNEQNISVTLRQVVIPTLNDNWQNYIRLADILRTHACIDKVELLPFKKICAVKYENMGIPFAFEKYDTPDPETVSSREAVLTRSLIAHR